MLITGSTYRSIASQNILSYAINGNINSTTGISSFGLSGENGSLNLFTFRTGKIYDANNRHVWSYNPSESFAISGNINTGDHHYYINNNLICLSTPKPDHYYKYFYANSQNSVMDLDINVIGNNYPNHSISFPFTYTIGDNITGYISNNSDNSNFSFQFFTGQTIGQPYYSLFNLDNNFVSGAQSVEFILNYTSTLSPNSPSSGAGELEPLLGNLSFNTNFGNVVYNLNIPINKRPYYFADFIEIFTGIVEQDSFFNYNYVYELRTKSPTDQDVFISLSNKAGHLKELYSGAFSSTVTISNTLSGFIYGDDYLTGILTGNVVSDSPDYYGNLVTGFATGFESVQQSATGLINYYYRVPVPGGSALGTAVPGTIIEATGYLNNATGISFIYGSRTAVGSTIGTGILSGYFGPHLQTGTGFIEFNEEFLNYFTGVSIIDNVHFNWDSIPYIGYDIENSNSNYKIYGITGSGNYTFTSSNSGVLTTSITTQQRTGELINYIFRLNSDEISNISGEIFGSENTDDLRYVFGEDSSTQWGTSPNISTGFLGFEFKNFSPNDSGIIRHYELNLDRNFFNYKFTPNIFKLQGSNNNTSWQDMDTRSGINFYRSQTNIFPVTGTGLYNYVRLLITSGQLLQHVNQNDLDTRDFGLSVNKIYFYEKTVSGSVTGLYKNFIDNNVTGDYFYSSFNTGTETDYLFSNDQSVNLFFATRFDDTSVEITGGFIGYKTAYVYTGNIITGFYIKFEPDYSPPKLIIEASNGGSYKKFYEKAVTSNIQSGLLSTGIVITDSTGYNYFRFSFIDLDPEPLDPNFGRESATCVTGWKAATGDTFPESFPWTDVALSNNAGRALLTTNFTSGASPAVTGFIFQNSGGYNQNFVARNFTGGSEQEVKIKSIAFDKNSGRHVLFCRDGLYFYTGAVSPDPTDFKIRYNSGFLNNPAQTRATGFDGAWTDVAISHDGRVMAAVGLYDFDRHPVTIQISLDTGHTWTQATDLWNESFNESFCSISMSSGGKVMYATPDYPYALGTYLWRSVNSGVNWEIFYNFSDELRDVATDNSGKYIIVAGNGYIYNSEDSGVNWSTYGGVGNWQKVAMSNDGRYQLATAASVGSTVRSDDYGVNWVSVTGLNAITVKSAAISSGGKFQYVVPSDTGLYNSCTFGYDLPYVNTEINFGSDIKVQKLNLYTSRQKDFFDLNRITITGFGNVNILSTGFGTGFLANPTGEIFFPAVSYETGLLNGLITDGGSYTWNNISISSTGRPNNVFVDRVTGVRNASGIIRFKMDLIRDFDYITINDNSFVYRNQISDSNYNFHDLSKLINVLNSGATGALDDYTLSNIVGVTGSLNIDSFKTNLLTGISSTYGTSVDISNNNIIVVGGPGDGINGAAKIYSKNTNNNNWDFYQRITGNLANGGCGRSLSINNDGTKIALGCPIFNSSLGGFDIYSGDINNGWYLQQSVGGYFFNPPGVGGYASWGSQDSIAINSGNRIVIGGYAGMNGTGLAALYTGINNFQLAALILAPGSVISFPSQPNFGKSVAINNIGNVLVVGAPHTVGGYGNICIYNATIPTSLSLVHTFNEPNNNTANGLPNFGTSVAINDSGNIIVVGTPNFSTGVGTPIGGYRVGLISIYTGTPPNSWALKQEITGITNYTFLGTVVNINSQGNVIVAGGVNNERKYYTGDPINGWGFFNGFTGLSINTAMAVNNNIVVGGYGSNSLASVSEVNDASIRLFSHNPSGENGNNTKLTRYASNLSAIQIPNRYLLGGQTFRPLGNTWEGNFEETFNFTVENSGIYTVQSEENIFIDISGVAYENNFYPNWSGDVTLISEGAILNTGLTINLLPDIYWRSSQVFTGTNSSNANLGTKVFTKNNVILVSQPNGAFAGGNAPGPVIFYTGNNNRWLVGANLTGNFGLNEAEFGTSLATWDSSPIVFGGPLDNNGTGSALIYTINTPTSWILRTKLTGIIDKSPQRPFGGETSKYGTNVAVSSGNDIILMSSPWNNTGYGSTLIYTGNISIGWIFKQELYGQKQGFYGQGLAIDDNADVIILGGTWGGTNSPYPTDGGINIFTGNKINGWTFAKDISGENGGNYGESVAVNKDGSTIVIGSRFDGSGAILIYTGNKINSSWKFAQKISGDFSQFGTDVSISDNDIIIVSSNLSNKTSIFTKNLNTNKWETRPKFIFNSDDIGGTYISNSGTIVVGLPNLDSSIYTNAGGFTVLNSGLDILTGMYRIPSGLSYLGYSGLNIEFNKYIYDNSKTGIDFAEYSVTSDNFTFTGMIRG